MRLLTSAGVCGLLTALVIGCSSTTTQIPTVSVSGTVTLDGEPIEEGSINFIPEDGKNPTTGDRIENGRFTVRVPLGLMKVAIKASRLIGERKAYDTADSPMIDEWEETVPAKYNSATTLESHIEKTTSQLSFELTSK